MCVLRVKGGAVFSAPDYGRNFDRVQRVIRGVLNGAFEGVYGLVIRQNQTYPVFCPVIGSEGGVVITVP